MRMGSGIGGMWYVTSIDECDGFTAMVMLPLVCLCLYLKGPPNLRAVAKAGHGDDDGVGVRDWNAVNVSSREGDGDGDGTEHDAADEDDGLGSMLERTKSILSNELYVLLVLGYSFQTFVVGGFRFVITRPADE